MCHVWKDRTRFGRRVFVGIRYDLIHHHSSVVSVSAHIRTDDVCPSILPSYLPSSSFRSDGMYVAGIGSVNERRTNNPKNHRKILSIRTPSSSCITSIRSTRYDVIIPSINALHHALFTFSTFPSPTVDIMAGLCLLFAMEQRSPTTSISAGLFRDSSSIQ